MIPRNQTKPVLSLKPVVSIGSGTSDRRSNEQRKQRPWSHQRELANAKGQNIEVLFDGVEVPRTFRLVDADQYTLKLFDLESQSTLTYFKAKIVSYRVI